MTIAAILGLLFISGLVSGETKKNALDKRFFFSFGCDGSKPALEGGMTWANDWDGFMDFSCSYGNSVSTLDSRFRECRHDRIWSFSCRHVGGDKTCSDWTDWVNEWDGPLNYTCDKNGYVSGLRSEHDNGREDRRYKILCCTSAKFKTVKCETRTLNEYKQNMKYELSDGKVIVGLRSIHLNEKEDRQWVATICKLRRRR